MSGRGGKNSKAVREFKAAGNKAMQAGSFQKAMRLYTKALDLDAGNAILYSNRSAAHFNTRQFSESLEDAESAILCDSIWWKAYKRKGLALIHMQRYEEAIESLEDGLKIVGKNAEMEKNLEFARACQEQAQNLYILPEPHMMQRLESVPVFIVTDNVGQPFFVTYDDGQQVCTFYFDQQDAISTLDWIKSENPDLGDTARVIHITLHQAFNLAQETQKQYYEETTRAAAEEDLRAAAEAEARKKGKTLEAPAVVVDVDGDEEDDKTEQPSEKASLVEESNSGAEAASETIVSSTDAGNTESGEANSEENVEKADKSGNMEEEKKKEDDAVIDENAPLSFQFRPELRQVKVAVELLNKHPDPPVKPILRDPPSVRKAKAEAAAAAAAGAAKTEGDTADNIPVEPNHDAPQDDKEQTVSDEGDVTADKATLDEAKEGDANDGASKTEASESETKESETKESETTEGEVKSDDDQVNILQSDVKKIVDMADDEDVDLTVDNFNGIPIFQAKGLTLLQKNKQLIPLFFSKWDLEDAWKQLKQTNAMDVPGECDIDVGTLEDVLRRMSESKTDEFQSVFFVPSRESMKAINAKFPLDDLASSNPSSSKRGIMGKPAVKKAGFSKAKQIAARGGTKDEVRAAIKEDLEKHAERQRMAEIIAQIEQAGRTGSVGGLGRVLPGAGGSTPTSTSAKSSKTHKTGASSKAGTVA